MMKVELTQTDFDFLHQMMDDFKKLIAENNRLKNENESLRKAQIDFDAKVIMAFHDTFRALERKVPELSLDLESIKQTLMG